MKDSLKAIGGIVLSIGFMVAVILVIAFFIRGGVWVSSRVLPWLSVITLIVLASLVFVLLPLSIVRAARGFTSAAILISSYVFGLNLWIQGLLLTYSIWGGFAVFAGLFLFGIGVVPIAMLATLIKGMWLPFGELVLLATLTFGSRLIAAKIAQWYGPVQLAESAPTGTVV